MVNRGSVVNWGGLVHNRCWLVWYWGRLVHNWCWFVHNWGGLVSSRGGNICRGNFNNWSRSICWGNLHNWDRGGLVSWSWSCLVWSFLRIDSHTLVLHISNISLRTSSVGHNLHTAIGKVDPVLPIGVVVSPVLLVSEHSSGVGWVIHAILVIVHWRKVWVCFLWGVWGRGASSRGYSYYYSKKDLRSHVCLCGGGWQRRKNRTLGM